MIKKIMKSILICSLILIGGSLINSNYSAYGYVIDDNQCKMMVDNLLMDFQFKNYMERKNGLTVDNDKTWTIKFNHNIKINNNSYNYIYVLDENHKKVPIILKNVDKNTIEVIPKNPYIYEKEYQLVIDKGLSGLNSIFNNKTIKNFKIAPNIKNFIMYQKPLVSITSLDRKPELKHNFSLESIDSFILRKEDESDFSKVIHWPIIWNQDDVEKIPTFKFAVMEGMTPDDIVEPGTYYVRGYFAGFDPKCSKFSFTHKITIDNDVELYKKNNKFKK